MCEHGAPCTTAHTGQEIISVGSQGGQVVCQGRSPSQVATKWPTWVYAPGSNVKVHVVLVGREATRPACAHTRIYAERHAPVPKLGSGFVQCDIEATGGRERQSIPPGMSTSMHRIHETLAACMRVRQAETLSSHSWVPRTRSRTCIGLAHQRG